MAGEQLTLGSFLRSIREGEEMTMVDFASELGISRSHLNDIEKGNKAVSPQKAVEYAQILGYSEQQFVRLALQDLLDRYELPYSVELSKNSRGL
ncbi:helix-turn-helix domain-containing protein [Pseudobacteriovorax antillogorgiicola]|nr:helix-turn-helix transcriptional regulator [Pseudobacteriovorax antillogorgiicola]